MCVLVTQLCPILCDHMDCSPPGSSVYGILQASILEWVAISLPGDLPDPGTEPRSLALLADSLPYEPLGKMKYAYCKTCIKWKVKVAWPFLQSHSPYIVLLLPLRLTVWYFILPELFLYSCWNIYVCVLCASTHTCLYKCVCICKSIHFW